MSLLNTPHLKGQFHLLVELIHVKAIRQAHRQQSNEQMFEINKLISNNNSNNKNSSSE